MVTLLICINCSVWSHHIKPTLVPSLTASSSTQVLMHIFHASLNSFSSVPFSCCPFLMKHVRMKTLPLLARQIFLCSRVGESFFFFFLLKSSMVTYCPVELTELTLLLLELSFGCVFWLSSQGYETHEAHIQYSMYPALVFIFLQCCHLLPPPFSLISQFTLTPL